MTVFRLFVPGPLPGMNDIIAAAKGARGTGRVYSALKKRWNELVAALARAHQAPGFAGPVMIRFQWQEARRNRDPDNVAAAKKFVLDGLVAAGVLEGDGWRHVAGFTDSWAIGRPGVEVTITEAP